jgi:hypothetical protein
MGASSISITLSLEKTAGRMAATGLKLQLRVLKVIPESNLLLVKVLFREQRVLT